jgi:hypothetical protein
MEPERAEVHGWRTTGQYAGNPVALNARGLCDSALMARNVTFRCVDMTAVPDDLADYDFCWSSCALEHLGSLKAGVAFIRRSLECLRPGGLAVHTTEFNLSSNEDTLTTGPSVIYRRGDIQRLSAQLAEEGHQLAAVDFDAGRRILDRYVDLPPYWPAGSPVREFEPHLRLRIGPYDCTSIGLIVRKAGGEAVEASS